MSIVLDGSNVSTTGVINFGTAVASTSGTAIDFTGIPAGTKRITVMLSGVSTSGTSLPMIQLGSGSYVTTGYECGAWTANTLNANNTTGFIIKAANVAAESISGAITLYLANTSNKWVESGVIGNSIIPTSYGGGSVSGGHLSLSGTLDRIRITTVNGTDTFDAGSINILYE